MTIDTDNTADEQIIEDAELAENGVTDDAGSDAEIDDASGDAEDAEAEDDDGGAETFSRTYVEKLRRENQRYRERAGEADGLAQRLHTALVAATGRLADPSDLAFDAAHLDDPDALAAAVDELLTRKPHLASRRPAGDIGQGATRTADTVDLAEMLRARA
ncbi:MULTISPECIES: hypothetical protein [Mycobacterium]|uniref:hypothetical protein n=1 Tax=Mycobacterium TaxID=1763 RepID=UPI000A039966|nr:MULTISPECIES: hypothetical protein [Mycobacterium]GLB90939.1 hypothetical protein SRL2020130_37560 [Mycobacterium kiyosense]GLC13380.1 hypothetical protein SRL2020448_19830 [Mycobacterium kiyosense]